MPPYGVRFVSEKRAKSCPKGPLREGALERATNGRPYDV